MRRAFFVAVLLPLLLVMQHERFVHALRHLGPQLARAHDTGLAAPSVDTTCSECALLAGGANAVHDKRAAPEHPAPATKREWFAFRSHATGAPVYFSSRAPPALL